MADTTITDLNTAVGIDPSTDWLAIDQSTSTNKINRNTLLGITSTPVGISDVQTISNKTVGVSNTVTLLDTLFTLQDNSDNTKQARFQLSGITTATTRTYTLPDASSTIADISSSQTFTNKTLTAPVITGGSMSNTAISVDSISEYTSANGVSVDGLNIKDGKLNSNNSVVQANLTNGIVSFQKLAAGATNIGFNLNAGAGSITTSYVSYATVSGASTGGRVQLEWSVVAFNASSGANRTMDVRVTCDGVEVDAITGLAILLTGTPKYTYSFTFEHTPSSGAHTWALQLRASVNTAVTVEDNFLNVSEVK